MIKLVSDNKVERVYEATLEDYINKTDGKTTLPRINDKINGLYLTNISARFIKHCEDNRKSLLKIIMSFGEAESPEAAYAALFFLSCKCKTDHCECITEHRTIDSWKMCGKNREIRIREEEKELSVEQLILARLDKIERMLLNRQQY